MIDLIIWDWIFSHLFQLVLLLVTTPLLVYVSLAVWSDIQSRNHTGEKWERRNQAFGSFLVESPFWLV